MQQSPRHSNKAGKTTIPSVRLSWLENAYIRSHLFRQAILARKVLACDQDSLAGLRKITSLCVQRLRFVPPWLTSQYKHRQTAY